MEMKIISIEAIQYDGNAVRKKATERIAQSVNFPLFNALTTPKIIDVIITITLEIIVNFNVFINAGPMRSATGSPVM